MKLIKIGTIILLGSTAFAACGGTGDGDTGGTGGEGATPGTGGAGNDTGAGNTGNTTSTGAATGAGGTIGTGGGGNTACTTVAAGALADPVKFFGGDSTPKDGTETAGTGSLQYAGPEEVDPDAQGAGAYPWVSVSYALAEQNGCADLSGLTSISLDVTSANAASMRIGISIPSTTPVAEGGTCTDGCSNHFVLAETFTAGQTKTITINADGSNLGPSWTPSTFTFTPNNVLQLVVNLLPDPDADPASDNIPAYDITVSNISAQ